MHDETSHLLHVDALVSGYGKKQILGGVTLHVSPGEIVALVGHNGAGKSTFLKVVFGMLPIWAGSVAIDGALFYEATPQKLLRVGIAYAPQGNRIFSNLTVRENLELGGLSLANKARLTEGMERVLTRFPDLKSRLHRRAGTLSGGAKQMLALANILVLSPRLCLLDEPSLGLAPPLVTDMLQRIQQISCDSGSAVLIVEQKVREVLKIAKRVYVLRGGKVSFSGPVDSLTDEAKLRDVYL